MSYELILYGLIGFIAQLVDSAIGMAFGSLTSSLLMLAGVPPQSLSVTVHMAEIFGSSASAYSHWRIRNIDYSLIRKLAFPAISGAIMGAYLVTHIDNQTLKPWLGLYFLVIGCVIIIKTMFPAMIKMIKSHREALGFAGGFLDAFGGAGWGEFVSSGLILRGHDVRSVVGSLVTVELFVSVVISVVFFTTIGISHWPIIAALAIGAILAAPLGAWICKNAPTKLLTLFVGGVIMVIGLKTIITSF